MSKWKAMIVISFSLVSFFSLGVGIKRAINSPLFLVKNVEVNHSGSNSVIDDQTILRLARIPTGKIGLFAVDLEKVRQILLANEWIQNVRLQRKLPHTISIFITDRQAKAVIQGHKGVLAYVDEEGKIFGTVRLSRNLDLPLLSGFQSADPGKIQEALQLLAHWERSQLSQLSLISSIELNPQRGYRVLVSYVLAKKKIEYEIEPTAMQVRTMIDLGHPMDSELDERLSQLGQVIHYLSGNLIAVRYIWANAGKKVVVKMIQGS
jgi:cell division septal protein FtsQ